MNPQELVAKGLTPEWTVFLTSMLPIVELRGALPLAINLFHIAWPKAFLIAVVGNMVPIPFILLLLEPIVKILSRIKFMNRFFSWLFERTRKKGKMVEKYEELGLMIFVAIPLPVTGGWTGALIAYLLGLEFKKAILFIGLGVFIAGVIVTTLCLLGWLGAIIAGVALIVLTILGAWRI